MQTPHYQRDERVLVVWSDDLEHIVPLCNEFDEKMMKLVWRSRLLASPSVVSTPDSTTPITSTTPSNVNLNEKPTSSTATEPIDEKAPSTPTAAAPKKSSWSLGWKLSAKKSPQANNTDPEKGSVPAPRGIRLLAPLYGGLGWGLALCTFTSQTSLLIQKKKKHLYI